MEETRDLLRDLELCEKATPGPWEIDVWYATAAVNDGSNPYWNPLSPVPRDKCALCHEELVREYKDELGRTMHLHKSHINDNWRSIYNTDGVQIVGAYDYEDNGMCTTREDAEFITSSRTGWPHANERALKAEAELERMKRQAEILEKALSLATASLAMLLATLEPDERGSFAEREAHFHTTFLDLAEKSISGVEEGV